MKIDLDEINNNVVPRLNNSVNYLEEAINSIAGCSIPEYFEYEEYMQKLPNNIRNIKNEVNVVKSWAENVANKFQRVETSNNSLINEINSNLNISNVSANINRTGATTRNTSSKQTSSNNVFEVIANNIQKGMNSVGAMVSAMWNSISNKISKTVVDIYETCKAKVVATFESLFNKLNFSEDNISYSKMNNSKSTVKLKDEPEIQEGLSNLNNLLTIQEDELKSSAEKMKNSLSSKTYNPYLQRLLKEFCNTGDFEDLSEVYSMLRTLKNLTEQLDLYIVDGNIPDYEIITDTDGKQVVQFCGLKFSQEEWKSIQHYLKSRGLTWIDLKEEFRESEGLLQTYYEELLGRKNSIYNLERYIDLYPYTYITTKDDFNSYLERDYKDVNPEGEFNILTQEEKAIYFYLKEKYSEEEAKEYYKSLDDLINQRKGEFEALEYLSTLNLTGCDVADQIIGIMTTAGIGFEDGVCQFGENLINLIPGQGETKSVLQYKQTYILSILTQDIDLNEIAEKYGKDSVIYKTYEKVSKIQPTFKKQMGLEYNVACAIGNQAIPIAISVVANEVIPSSGGFISSVGLAAATYGPTALSAAGAAKSQAYQNGVTGWNAYLYAGIQGISSAVVSKHFAAIPGISQNASTSVTGILKGATEARSICCCTVKS